MPQRRGRGPTPGTIKKACPGCATPIALSQLGCTSCWKTVPAPMQKAYMDAKYGSGASEADLNAAAVAIELQLRGIRT